MKGIEAGERSRKIAMGGFWVFGLEQERKGEEVKA